MYFPLRLEIQYHLHIVRELKLQYEYFLLPLFLALIYDLTLYNKKLYLVERRDFY